MSLFVDRSGALVGALLSILLMPAGALAADAQADKLLTIADDGVGVLLSGDEARLVAEQGMSFGGTGFGKRMGLSMPLSAGTRTAILDDPSGAWTFGFKGYFELGYSSAQAFDKRARPVRLVDGWDTSLTPSGLCSIAQQVASEPGSVEGGFIGWLDRRMAISDFLALGDLEEALAASRTLDRAVADGSQVDHSGGALSAWVSVAHHLGAGRTQRALDVASGDNAVGVVLPDLVGLLKTGLVEDAGDAASTLPSMDCAKADASLLAALSSRDLASIAAAADVTRTYGRATRAALLSLVDGEVCAALADVPGAAKASCRMAPERFKALGITMAEVAGGSLDLDKLPDVDRDLAANVNDAAAAVGRSGSDWSDALRAHYRVWSPGVSLCMDAPRDSGVMGPRGTCDPTDADGTASAEEARWNQAQAAWAAAEAGWGMKDQAMEGVSLAIARYATRDALMIEVAAIQGAVNRRISIETDLELVEEELQTAKGSDKEDLEERKLRFAKELAEDLLSPGAATRVARLERIKQESADVVGEHGAALDTLPGLLAAQANIAAARAAFRGAERRWAQHEDAWASYRHALKTAPYENARAWGRHVARNIVAPMDLRGPHWSAGLQVAGGYDRLDVYLGDLHPTSVARAIHAFSVELGAQGTISTGPVTFQARLGVAVDQTPKASQTTFCRPALNGGGPPESTDQDCHAVPFITSRPQPMDSGFVRFGALLLSPNVVPSKSSAAGFASMRGGLDLRLGLEDLGRDTLLETKVTVLAFPTLGPMKGRYGVGFRSVHHLTACDAAAGTTSACGGQLKSFTPFVFLGGSFLK